jgi:hypothetical protein
MREGRVGEPAVMGDNYEDQGGLEVVEREIPGTRGGDRSH